MKNKPCQTGLSLIEIMIALLIGAFLLGGVLEVFIGSKQTYRMQGNLSRLQENGRFAIDFLAKDISMAGYWGCLRPSTSNVDIAGTNDVDNYTDSNGNVIYTDSITLRGAYSQIPAGTCGNPVPVSPPTAPPYYIHPSSTVTYRINNGVLRKNTDDLIEGVENMQILYGVDTDSNGSPNYYVSANNVTNMG
jgi:type IV pilus assembly protein PilW